VQHALECVICWSNDDVCGPSSLTLGAVVPIRSCTLANTRTRTRTRTRTHTHTHAHTHNHTHTHTHTNTHTHTHTHTERETPSGQKKEECEVTNQFEILGNRWNLYAHLNADATNSWVFTARCVGMEYTGMIHEHEQRSV
jgi:ABC-type Zn2+ transport system substrate-binding protein/surface adhesin